MSLTFQPASALAYLPARIPPACELTAEQRHPYRGIFKSRMQEWSYLRATPKTADKFRANDLNTVHKRFVDCEMDLSDYVLKLLEYLSRDCAEADAAEFLTTHAVGIETGTFLPTHGRFAKFLDAQWDSWCARHRVARAVPDPTDLDIAPEPPVVVKRPTPDNLVAAREKFNAKEAGAEDELFRMLYRYALGFTRAAMRGCPDYLNLSDDAASIAVTYIWRKMASFNGTAHQFVKWCRTICRRAGVNGLHSNLGLEDDRQPLEILDPENLGLSMDNPALHRDKQPEYARALPDFIQGTDKLICGYIRQNLSYEQIAATLVLTESGVRNRIASMRTKVQKLKTLG